MFQVKKSTLVILAIFLATSAQTFASTTVSCAVEPYGVPPAISLTNPAACSFSGSYEAGVYTSYGVSASASTSASARAGGSVLADAFGDLMFDGLSPFAGSLSSEADLDAQFTSTGPVRLGTLFAASLSRPFVNADSFFNGVSTTFTGFAITQGSFSYHNQCVIVEVDFCSGETIPIYLGLPFTISVQSELSVNWVNNPRSTDYFNYADVGVPDDMMFTLQEQEGATVDSLLVPDQTTSDPEPSTHAVTTALLVAAVPLKRVTESLPRSA